MKLYRILILIGILAPTISNAVEIAIIDQGLNTGMTNRGQFYNPICVGRSDDWYLRTNPNNPYTVSDRNGRVQDHNRVGMQRISLCTNGFNTRTRFDANVPRFRSLPPMGKQTNGAPDIFREMVLLRSDLSIALTFNPPFVNKSFGGQLVHGTNVATAAYRFNNNVRRKMMQIYSIAPNSTRTPALSCNVRAGSSMSQSSPSIGGAVPILLALREIIRNPDGVDAINMSIVFRSAFCERAQGNFTPSLCEDGLNGEAPAGQDEVDALRALGIPFVVGLENKDIGGTEVTWPACLDGVIKVGNRDVARNSIGVGAMDIDFYALDTTTGERGNSFAAPRIATAFAMLKEAVPNSTIEQRSVALSIANTRQRTYNSGTRTFTRRDVRKTDIPQAIIELRELVRTNIDEIFFNDSGEYGPINGGSNTPYAFNIDFDQLIGRDGLASKQADQVSQAVGSAVIPSARDVVLSFEGAATTVNAQFVISINGQNRAITPPFRGTRNFSMVLNRNSFREGENTIRISTSFQNWGLKNIKADFHPVVSLNVGQTDTNEYGYSQVPERFTGLRTAFNLSDIQGDYILGATGWDMDRADENEVFLNGESLGFLNQGPSSAYSPRSRFIIRASQLEQGNNVVEFVQRRPDSSFIPDSPSLWRFFEDEKWAVKDIRIERALADLAVTSIDITDHNLATNVPFEVTTRVANVGIGSSIVNSAVRFYASTDKNITPGDIQLKTLPFAPILENGARGIATTVQTSLVNQDYYFGACIDPVPTEGNLSNNCSEGIKLASEVNITPIIMLLLDDARI